MLYTLIFEKGEQREMYGGIYKTLAVLPSVKDSDGEVISGLEFTTIFS